jgi:predicted mannosyl-3-phosphoglycerate phosphatase (HAD superfamily)
MNTISPGMRPGISKFWSILIVHPLASKKYYSNQLYEWKQIISWAYENIVNKLNLKTITRAIYHQHVLTDKNRNADWSVGRIWIGNFRHLPNRPENIMSQQACHSHLWSFVEISVGYRRNANGGTIQLTKAHGQRRHRTRVVPGCSVYEVRIFKKSISWVEIVAKIYLSMIGSINFCHH